MKYVTKENFQQYNATLKDYIDDTFTQDLTSYGVSWKPNVADPHLTRVGNMTYHKSLPIQNNMKGCIAQMKDGAKIIYYLNHNDWRFKENPDYLYNKQVIDNTITDDVFKDLKYEHQYIKINNNVLQVKSINTETKTASIEPIESGTYDIELGSCTNGYDGEVMVEVPEFWIKSWDTDTRREVRITPSYIDDSWEHQPHILIGAYKDTVLNTVPTNMGYLSTLEVNSAVCIRNIHDYCRGGNNSTSYDQYITTDRFRSMLGKPHTQIDRAIMRVDCRRSGKEILSYLQYKRVFYWLYIIEYANFNSQEEFKEELTTEGFKQGGLGEGVTNPPQYEQYNKWSALIPNGYTNEFGNGTNIKAMTIVVPTAQGDEPTSSVTKYVPRWHGIENPFGDTWSVLDGNIIIPSSIKNYNKVYATDDPLLYSDSNYSKMQLVGTQLVLYGNIMEWDLGSTAEIIPRAVKGSYTQYKCDLSTSIQSVELCILVLGGDAGNANTGLGSFKSTNKSVNMNYGYRSTCVIK